MAKQKPEIVMIKVEDIKPYSKNPRINDLSVKNVANSIKEFGFRQPILLDKNNVVIAGHTRLKASKQLGLKEVPCIIADDLDDEKVKALRIADNSASSQSEWDIDLLKLELDDITFDMTDFGLEAFYDDEVQEKPKERKIERMELRAFEHYDYLVFVFDNQFDFMNMAQKFGLHKVDAGYTTRKLGIGRVLKGEELVKRLGDTNSNIE